MNSQIREAYYAYLDDLARAGIIDHALNNAVLEGQSVEAHIVESLRAAGRLPEGWDPEGSQRGWQITTVAGDHWRVLAVPRAATASPIKTSVIREGHARLHRADLAHAS